jgi:hypothetical protein
LRNPIYEETRSDKKQDGYQKQIMVFKQLPCEK